MSDNSVVRARINETTKRKATRVLKQIGLTPSSAIRLMMIRTAAEGHLPFEPLKPNAKTIAAIKAARRGETKQFDSVSALMKDLNDDKDD